MIEYNLAIAAGVVTDAWLLALVALRGRRPWLQATYGALALTFVVNGVAFVSVDEGFLPASWSSAVLVTLVLAHPLTAILVLGLIHGESLPRRRPVAFLLLLAVPEFLVFTPAADWTAQRAYDLNPLGAFLIACLAIALAEPIYQRMTSALYSRDAFWLIAGVIALVVGGPVYTFEFEGLGLGSAAGSNLASPFALGAFALVALRSAPYPTIARGAHRRWTGEGRLARGETYVFDETRPAYALQAVHREAAEGRPALVLARSSVPPGGASDGPDVALIEPDRHAASRILTSASEFMAHAPGALVAVPDLGDAALLSGWRPTREMVLRLGQVARGTKSTVLLSPSCLLPEEAEELRSSKVAWWTLPDPAQEIQAVLARSFGGGARQLLATFARSRGLRARDLTADHVPALVAYLEQAIAELGGPVADPTAIQGLREQTEAATRELEAFAARTAGDLSAGEWPSKVASSTDGELLVTAQGYWKGKEIDELFAAAAQVTRQEPLFDRARAVFVEQLGDAGEGMLRTEIAKLGKRPEDLRAEDVARLADRAAVDLGAMAEVVDLPQERLRIRSQVDSIRRRLEAIAGDGS